MNHTKQRRKQHVFLIATQNICCLCHMIILFPVNITPTFPQLTKKFNILAFTKCYECFDTKYKISWVKEVLLISDNS